MVNIPLYRVVFIYASSYRDADYFSVVSFFLVTLIYFLYEPQVKKHTYWLAATSALTFYFYNYLAFIVFLTLASIFFVVPFFKTI